MSAITTNVTLESFNDFLKLNRDKIRSIAPKNPTICKDDEWVKENFWDEHYKELTENGTN